ncbi:hypothetical protein QPX96_05935 [Limosilactobacillus fermentum]|nr:hypothetical protein [Limosilactobacillus fermentum]
MIQKFRRRFIAISTCALFVVLLTILGACWGSLITRLPNKSPTF